LRKTRRSAAGTLGESGDNVKLAKFLSPGAVGKSIRKFLLLSQPPSDPNAPESAQRGENSPSGDPEALLSEARRQLRAALDTMDQAIGRHAERAREQADRAAEYSALQEDRSRLAQELDAALTRIGALEKAIGEAARRIERASAAVRAVLSADDAWEG